MAEIKLVPQKPTAAFIGVSWLVLLIGVIAYLVSLYNAANMELSEKGLYFTLLMFGLFSVISIQKTIRDKAEDIPVTNIYYGIAWGAVIICIGTLIVSLWNDDMPGSDKTVYGLALVFSLFAAIAVQKNVRDLAVFDEIEKASAPKRPAPAPNGPVQNPSQARPATAADFGPPHAPRV